MDFQDVTDQYKQMLQSQRQTLMNAKRRVGQKPVRRKSKRELINEFMVSLAMFKMKMNTLNFQTHIHSSFVPPAYAPCDKSVLDLQRITINDLRLETHHRGKYLLLRSLTPPSNMTSLTVLVEDLAGDVVRLALYHQLEAGRPDESVITQGSVVVVKEPYLKVTGDGDYGLRVDHLSDILFSPEKHITVPIMWQVHQTEASVSAEAWKLGGNAAMAEGKYWEAIQDYTNALEVANLSETEVIKRNRALAFLKIGHFDATLSDLAYPCLDSHSSPKALVRAAEALYHLARFEECIKLLELLLAQDWNKDLASKNLRRARDRLHEQHKGKYDFVSLQKQAKNLRPPIFDHASFLGNVEIRQAGSCGRALFVTKAIKMGEVIMVEKAFAYAFADDQASNVSLLMHPESNRATFGTQSELLGMLVHRVHNNPSLATRLTNLHHGSHEIVTQCMADSQPVTDTFLVDCIMSLNGFGCPTSSLESHQRSVVMQQAEEERHSSTGIWTHASYINHNCMRSAARSFIGDMMIIRATRDLEAGEEVTFWYRAPNARSAAELHKDFAHWSFACDCTFCTDIRVTSAKVISERKKAFKHVGILLKADKNIDYNKIKKIVSSVESTYAQPPDKAPRRQLWDLYLRLASEMLVKDKLQECLEFGHKGLTSLGYIMSDPQSTSGDFKIMKPGLIDSHVPACFLQIATVFGAIGKPKSAKQALQYARLTYKICVGEDSTFDATYQRLIPSALQ